MPFEIPESWEWCRFGTALVNRDAERIPLSVADRSKLEKIYDYYGASGVIDKVDKYLFDKPLLLIGEDGANLLSRSTPIAFIASGYYWVNNHAHVIDSVGGLLLEYIAIFINSISLAPYVTGTAQPKMNQEKMNSILVAIPPVNEQRRIIEKINSVLPYIDEYTNAESNISTLNTTFPDQLKKSILQQAIQGKLVPQDPLDEPASVLLERIRAEKQELIKAGKIKKDKNESVIFKRDNSHYELCGGVERCIDEEIPFEVPESWVWCRLNNCCIDIADIDHKMPEQVENGIPYISPLNFTDNNGIDYDSAKKISYTDYEKLAVKCTPECDDIIFPRYGTIGVLRYITTNRKFLVSYSCATIKPSKTYSLPIYIYYALQSPWIQNNEIMRYINKTTQPNIGLQSIKNFLIPIPPLSEQKRIVSKIEELIPLIQTL